MLDSFFDSDAAFNAYRNLHQKEPQRELYIAHTKKDNMNYGLEIDGILGMDFLLEMKSIIDF